MTGLLVALPPGGEQSGCTPVPGPAPSTQPTIKSQSEDEEGGAGKFWKLGDRRAFCPLWGPTRIRGKPPCLGRLHMTLAPPGSRTYTPRAHQGSVATKDPQSLSCST